MAESAVLAELRRVRDEVTALRRLVERLAPSSPLTPAQRAVVERLHAVYGTGPFTTREAVDACALPLAARRALRDAIVLLVGALDAQRLGIALARIVELGGDAGPLRLTAPRSERDRRLWCIECRTATG